MFKPSFPLKSLNSLLIVTGIVLLVILPSSLLFIVVKLFIGTGVGFLIWNPNFKFFMLEESGRAEETTELVTNHEEESSASKFNIDQEFENYTQNVLISLKSLTQAHTSAVLFYNEFKEHFKIGNLVSSSPELLVSEKYFSSDEGVFKLIKQNPKPIIEKEIEISPKLCPIYKSKLSSSGTMILFPFSYMNKFFGVIYLDHPDAHAISQEQIVKAEKIVRNFEIFFNFSSQLFEYQLKHKLEKSYSDIANKYNTSLSGDELWNLTYQFLQQHFKFERAMIILTETPNPVDDSGIIIHRIFGTGAGFSEGDEYSLNDGVVSWCILQKQSLKFNDVYKRNKKLYRFEPDESNQLATRSVLITPLVSGNYTYGAIVLESQLPYQYGETEKELLTFLSQQLSHALRRIMLFEKMAAFQAKDPELGIWNSQSFRERLEEEILRSKRFEHPFSVVFFHVKFLSGTNDYLDVDQKKILKEIVDIIKAASRKIDWIGTIQGTDISILLLETDKSGAEVYIRRILDNIKKSANKEIFSNIKIKISVTYTSYPVLAKSSEEIINQLKESVQTDGSHSLILELNQ